MTLFVRLKRWLLGLVHWRQPDGRGSVQETTHERSEVLSEQMQPPRPELAAHVREEQTESRHDEETEPPQSAPEPEPAPAPADAPAAETQCIEEPRPNRKARRAQKSDARRYYEKQRRKFDQFVEPQGPLPAPIERTTPSTPSPADPATESAADVDDDDLIVDCHHSDRTTKVLYDPREIWGEFSFRDTVLGQLERNLFYLSRMRKFDSSAYEFYRRVGTTLVPYAGVPDIYKTWHPEDKERVFNKEPKLSPWFLATRPAFGCIAYGTSPEVQRIEDEESTAEHKQTIIPRFLYFTKYLPTGAPPDLQPIRRAGDIYKMTVWWDQDKKKYKHGRPSDFGVFVSKAGEMVVLKMHEPKTHRIDSKKRGTGYVRRTEWCIPHRYEEWAQRHGTNAQMFLGWLFADLAEHCETSAYSMARVSVKKGENFVMFGIDPHRLPYFFKDRDYVLNDKGHRVPIFHCVRPHTVNGKARGFQFRGARKFTWAGYEVEITIPGMHHRFWDELDVGVLDWSRRKKIDDAVKTDVIGEMIRADMEGRDDDLDEITEKLRARHRKHRVPE